MSRLIVKNLPKVVNEQKLHKLFSQKGTITDLQLKYKDGKFRQFGFVGYENEESAQKAAEFFNDSFVGASKIKVEICTALGDEAKPKSWSKYSKDSESHIKKQIKVTEKKTEEINHDAEKERKKSRNQLEDIIEEHKDDPQFQEFMRAHAKDKLSWENDLSTLSKANDSNDEVGTDIPDHKKPANQKISDVDYMKQLIDSKSEIVSFEKKKDNKNQLKLFTIKVRNVPKKIKREEIKKFFRPSKAHSVRIPRNSNFCYVGFKLERDMKRALSKDKSFLKGKQIHVYEFTHQTEENVEESRLKVNARWQEQHEKMEGQESICDSGKLFFRNLPYNVSEDDVQKVFEKYGSIVEINVPIDSITRRVKGFGTVTFLMPEDAVRAYSELNGTLFHGRMFHILPGKANEIADAEETNEKNFKDRKRKELKQSAASAHNWNTLFMGANAVAELISKTFGKTKEEVLDTSTGGTGAAVRLALGETQIVLEMKRFLESNGVRLEAFDEDTVKRSKTVILVKNLPINTNVDELREKFEQFGVVEKVLLPPSGVTCIIQFEDPSEARKAFKKLAYSKFRHVPLYLEWAPENVFRSKKKIEDPLDNKEDVESENISKEINEHSENKNDLKDEDSTPPENGTTLFIKNLDQNANEESIKSAFRHIGAIHTVQIAKKKNTDGGWISLGYGFIQFKLAKCADKALKTMQMKSINGKNVELKRSDRTLNLAEQAPRKISKNKTQDGSTKIMVRNIPFQATSSEIRQLFQTFGDLKAVRLPRKTGVDQHRGFGFIDFINKSDAKNAFEAMHLSTHLYGRRLVLEWAATEEDVNDIRKRTAETSITGDSNSKRKRKALMKEEDFIKLENDNEVED